MQFPWVPPRPRLPFDSSLPELATVIFDTWSASHKKWDLEEIGRFSTLILSLSGDQYGWKGGSSGMRIFCDDNARCLAGSLRHLAMIARSIQERPLVCDARLDSMFWHYVSRLHYHGVLPSSVVSRDDIFSWLDSSLSASLARLRLRAAEVSAQSVFAHREAELFRDPKSRSKWLQLTGLKPGKGSAPRILRTADGRVLSSKAEVVRAYDEKLRPLLTRPISLAEGSTDSWDCIVPDPSSRVSPPPGGAGTAGSRCKPPWWDRLYRRGAKGIQHGVWGPLLAKITISELSFTISSLSPDTAVDIQGSSSNLLKALFFPTSPLLPPLCDLLNSVLDIGDLPAAWKEFYIVMIEKKAGETTLENLDKDLRPISIINEYAKLICKILANRLSRLLLEHDVLEPAQRAFLKNGSTHQCISTLINILEDAKQKRLRDPMVQFFMVAYDQKKAYDSVQKYSIRASLERFNLPEKFIVFILNIHNHLHASFRTFFGLTDPFEVLNGLQQGNPLAPLIFIMFTDALHEGLRLSPLRDDEEKGLGGYVFSRSHLRIASLGFADDLAVFAESWAAIFASHEWVLAFFESHGGEINSGKTIFVISDAIPNDSRWLRCPRGVPIRPQPSRTVFRYLGLFLNIELEWEKQIFIMKTVVTEFIGIMQRSGISAVKIFEAFKTILLPKLDLGLTFATIPPNFLNSWSRRILRAVFAADGWPEDRITSLSLDAFSDLVDTPLLLERYWGNKLSALLYDLNSFTFSGQSTRARLSALTGSDQSGSISLYSIRLNKRYSVSRFAKTIEFFSSHDCKIVSPPSGADNLDLLLDEGRLCLRNCISPLRLFTDGSSAPGDPRSGVGIVAVDGSGRIIHSIGCALLSSGNNFFAELTGVTIAALIAPDSPCEIISDSKSVIDCISPLKMSDRERARLPCRGWIGRLNRFLVRKPLCKVLHVHSHTGASDALSVGNDLADSLAKEARTRGPILANYPPTLDAGGVYLMFRGKLLMGGVKKDTKVVLGSIRAAARDRLQSQNRTLNMFSKAFRAIQKQVKLFAVQNSDQRVWSVFILNTLRWSCPPKVAGSRPLCPLCYLRAPDSMLHLASCPALSTFHNQINFVLRDLLHRVGISVPMIEDPLLWGSRFILSSPEVCREKINWGISERYLFILARRYVFSLGGRNPSPSLFVSKISQLCVRYNCRCGSRHICDFRNAWSTPLNLLNILVCHFRLQVEGCADPLHLSDLLPRYVSANQEDIFFGAEHDILKINLSGTNTFINPPFSGKVGDSGHKVHIIHALLRRWSVWCKGVSPPTRGIFLIPEPNKVGGREFLDEAEKLGGFRFFSSDFDSFEFWPPDAFRHEHPIPPGPYDGRIHLVLFQNQSAAVIDPISPQFFDDLDQWARREKLRCEIRRIPDSDLSPSPLRSLPRALSRCAISVFPSLIPPCPRQLSELNVSKNVKDFLLALTSIDPIPLLGGFLPSSLERLLKKHCLEYKREIELMRCETLAVINRLIWFKLSLANRITSVSVDAIKIIEQGDKKVKLNVNKKMKFNLKASGLVSGFSKDPMGHRSNKDATHCDRLKKFKY